jgi:protein-tyrosine phosphatase
MRMGFTDIHNHLLYNYDDGPSTYEDMCNLLCAAEQDAIESIMVTPHATPGILPFSLDDYNRKFEEAVSYCREKQFDIALYPGSEILYTEMALSFVREKRIPTLANTSYVLIEFSPDVSYDTMEKGLRSFAQNGYFPILAHAERYLCLLHYPKRVQRLKKDAPILFQVNCSSIVGKKGFFSDHFCAYLLRERLVDFVATDAHDVKVRPVNMKLAFKQLRNKYGDEYALQLIGFGGNCVLDEAGIRRY